MEYGCSRKNSLQRVISSEAKNLDGRHMKKRPDFSRSLSRAKRGSRNDRRYIGHSAVLLSHLLNFSSSHLLSSCAPHPRSDKFDVATKDTKEHERIFFRGEEKGSIWRITLMEDIPDMPANLPPIYFEAEFHL
jgi:hypothetical protein